MVDMTSVIYKQRSRSFILVSIHLTNIYISQMFRDEHFN